MTSQFSPKVSEILAFSREEAARLASRSVGPEHLLLGMLRSNGGPVIDLFRRLDLNLQAVKYELEQRVREDEINVPIHTTELVLNEKASNILKLAVLEARIQRTNKVDEQHLLLAILHDAVNNGAKQVLELNNMNYEDAMAMLFAKQNNNVTNGIGLPDEDEDEYEETGSKPGATNNAGSTTTTTAQKKALNLTKVFDPKVIRIAACLAIILAFCPKFACLVQLMPAATIGGVSLILYGMISAVGVRNLVEEKVDLKSSRNVFVAALILVLAIGVKYGANDNIAIGPIHLSGLAQRGVV